MIYFIALPWLALQLTGSGAVIGTVLAAVAVPQAIVMILGGTLADRYSPRAVLIASSILSAMLTTIFAIIVSVGFVEVWHLYVLSVLLGLINAVAYPAANVLLPRLVEEQHLNAGNSILGLTTSISIFIGPAISGFAVGRFGIWVAFLLSSLASLVAVVGIVRIKAIRNSADVPDRDAFEPEEREPEGVRYSVLTDIREGFSYVIESPSIRIVIVLLAVINITLVGPIIVGSSLMANLRFSGAEAYGLIISMWGAGGLVGALVAGTGIVKRTGQLLIGSSVIMGIGLLMYGLTPSLAAILLVTLIMGCVNGLIEVRLTTWIQIRADEQVRGRVMGITAFAAVGLEPVSYILTGCLAPVGLGVLFYAAGATLLVSTGLAAMSRALRSA